MRGLIDLAPIMFAEPAAEKWIQIMKCGQWDHPTLGKISITQSDLAHFKENFDAKVRGADLAVDVSHKPDDGAVAWFRDVEVRGDQLWALVAFTDEGAELVKSGKYRYFSPEFMFRWTDPESGKTYQDVLFGGALTNRPFLKNMEPIEFSEDGVGIVWFAEGESTGDGSYDPDGDGDDDATADPSKNPDWESDVRKGMLPWSKLSKEQQEQLTKKGFTAEHAAQANKRARVMMSEDNVTNSHKSPPNGKPKVKSQYADPEHYKYPIDQDHIRAAVSYFNQSGQKESGGYSDDQWAAIGGRIASAANKLVGPGHKYEDGKIVTPSTKMGENAGEPATHTNQNNGGVGMSENNTQTHPDGVVSLAEFQAAQDEIRQLKERNRRIEFTEKVNGLVRAGKVLPAQRDKVIDMLVAMGDDQVAKFNEFMDAQPAVVKFNDESGFEGALNNSQSDKDPKVMLSELTAQKVKEGIPYNEAWRVAFDELKSRGITFAEEQYVE